MKRFFAYLVLALLMSVLLCACGDTTGRGNVTASPWPDVTAPVMPTPSAFPSATPTPDFTIQNDMPGMNNGTGADNGTGMDNGTIGSSTPGMNTSTPVPTDTDQ